MPLPAQGGGLYDETVLQVFELTFKQRDWWQQLTDNYPADVYIKADLRFRGRVYPDVGVRFRGNTSYRNLPKGSKKKPFEISMDEFVPGQDLLGYDRINLNNNWADPTFVREVLSYHVFRRYVPAPKSNYATLSINGESWGVYINTQQVDREFQEDNGLSGSGNRYRAERTAPVPAEHSALTWLGTDPAAYAKAYELKTENSRRPWNDLIRLCDVLNRTPGAQLESALPAVIDVDNALWMLAVGNTILWLDSYVGFFCHSYYLHHDMRHDRFAVIPWDMNGSFGKYTDGKTIAQVTVLTPFYKADDPKRPLIHLTLRRPAWKARFVAHLRTLVDEVWDWSFLKAKIDRYHALIEAEVKKDGKRIYPLSTFKDSLFKDLRLFGRDVPGLKPLVDKRRAYLVGLPELKTAAPRVGNLSHAPARPGEKDRVTVTAKVTAAVPLGAVTLYHRVLGAFLSAPMFDDGKHGDGAPGDGVFGAEIAPQKAGSVVEYYVGARTAASSGGAAAFAPRTAGYRAPRYRVEHPQGSSPVRINELLARNDTGIKDEAGERDDWLELYNDSKQPVPVGGMYLTDKLAKPTKWQIPAGHSVPAGGTLLIWADEDGKQGQLHANFKLSATSGETVALFDTDGKTQLDKIAFGPQVADVSTGRLFDGKDPWVTYAAPTPRARNAPDACGTRRYSAPVSTAHRFELALAGSPKIGALVTLSVANGPASGQVALVTSPSGGLTDLGNDLAFLLAVPFDGPLLLPTNAAGSFSAAIRVPDLGSLVGKKLYMQVFGFDARGATGSNALEITFCPK